MRPETSTAGASGAASNQAIGNERSLKEYVNDRFLKVDEQDSQMWEYVSNVPKVSVFTSYICVFLNVVLPGSGTILASWQSQSNYISKTQIVIGLHQFLTALLIIGWIWSIYWAYLILQKAQDDEMIRRKYDITATTGGNNL